MKRFFTQVVPVLAFLLSLASDATAQCPANYTQSQINWDYLDYMTTSGNYTGFVTTAQANNQNFAMGPNRVTFAVSANITLGGENATHTGNLAGYTGQDVQYTPSADAQTVRITFETEVQNVSFSLYDIDRNALFGVAATNTALVPQTIAVSNLGSSLTQGGTPVARTFLGGGGNQPNNLNDGSVTLTIAGPVKSILITVTLRGTDPVFWLSDINGCVTGEFPADYHAYSRPFTGMPSYFITVVDSIFLYTDVATGRSKYLFTDFSNRSFNSLGYDPENRVLYYTRNRSGAGGIINPANRELKKYDLNTGLISVVTPNVTTSLNIPTFDMGVESAAASFYDSSFYMGVEGANSSRNSGRENVIWKVDFDASLNATRATQVYAARADSFITSNRLIHDWGDIGISNGIMYDFDIAANDSMYYHFDMMTGQRTQFLPSGPGFIKPSQTVIDWQGNVYNTGPTGTLAGTGFVVPYNLDGTVNAPLQQTLYMNPGPTFPAGNWADAAEAFRPLCDFGDAPDSYDPDSLSPAVHERDTALRIGATWDMEWIKTSSTPANADGADEDGLSYVPILNAGAATYLTQVSLYNNTGFPAKVIAWLDINGNGLFDAAEACQDVPAIGSAAAQQSVYLYWPNATNTFTNGTYTYLRVRMVMDSMNMTTANATGYYESGETEDYRVLVDNFPLSVNLKSFTAKLQASAQQVDLAWTTTGEENFTGFEIQTSANNTDWKPLSFVAAKGNGLRGDITYTTVDPEPRKGLNYYRLKMLNGDGNYRFSETRMVTVRKGLEEVQVTPNPATDKVYLNITTENEGIITITVTDISGKQLFSKNNALRKGVNIINLPEAARMKNGTYVVRVQQNAETVSRKLIINR